VVTPSVLRGHLSSSFGDQPMMFCSNLLWIDSINGMMLWNCFHFCRITMTSSEVVMSQKSDLDKKV